MLKTEMSKLRTLELAKRHDTAQELQVETTLDSVISELQRRYPSLKTDTPTDSCSEVHLVDSKLQEATGDIYPTEFPSLGQFSGHKPPQTGNFYRPIPFAIIKIQSYGDLYSVDQKFVFGGAKREGRSITFPRPLVMEIAELIAHLIDSNSDVNSWVKHYDEFNRQILGDSVHGRIYARSVVEKEGEKVHTLYGVKKLILKNIMGYIEYCKAAALMSRNIW